MRHNVTPSAVFKNVKSIKYEHVADVAMLQMKKQMHVTLIQRLNFVSRCRKMKKALRVKTALMWITR